MAEIAELDHMPSRLPVAVWQAFHFPYAMSIAGSMAHPAIKNLFDLWGSVDGEITRGEYVFTVDSGDLSVSTDFQNGDGDWCSLSLTGDGLVLAITNNGERLNLAVPADRLDQVELYEDWFSHIQLH